MIWCFFNPRGWLRAVLPGLIVLFAPCFAGAATLLWDRNPETNVVGYRVYVGKVSRGYDSVLDMGNSTSAVVPTSPGLNYFAVTAYDSDGLESGFSAEVTYADGIVNVPPVAGPDNYSTPKNTALNIAAAGVLANDSDADGQPLSAVLVAGPAHGSLTLNANGGFSYTPTANYTGADSFTYQCSDGLAASPVTTVSITITTPPPGNSAPVALNDTYSVAKDTALNVNGSGVLANDSDADGQPLTAILVNAPNHGVFTLNASGSFSYTPLNQFVGTDTFQYQASDGLTSSVATVTINVIGTATTNTPPAPQPDSYVVAKNETLIVSPGSGVIANDFDVDGQLLSVVQHGSTSRGEVVLYADGSLTYTPTNNFTGTDSFAYRLTDGLAYATPTTVTITITGAPPANTAPVAQTDSYGMRKNGTLNIPAAGVLANDSDADGNPLTAVLVSAPANGSLTLNANGSFSFTPTTGFTGNSSFTYRANDGSLNSANTTVTLSITNIAPVAQADSYATAKNIGLTIAASGVLNNDSDANGDALTASVVTAPAHGTLTLNANGSFTFTPTANYTGADSFTYRASDGSAFSANTTVTLTINNSNGAPVAVADSYTLAKNSTLNIAAAGVLANDSDPDGNPLTAVLVSAPANGSLTLNANGSFTFTPTAGFTGNSSFTYRANDGSLNSANTTVTLSITNIAPVAQADSYATAKNIGLTIAASGVLNNDSDANGDALTASVVTAPAHGTLTLNANGSFTFTPTANYTGADSFTYRASDGSAFSANTTVTLTINNSNGAPVAVADSYTLAKNSTLNIAAAGVLANDSDPDGHPLTAVLVSAPANGSLTLNANGSFTFTPTAGFAGSSSFTYRANDGALNSANTTVTLSITNTPPIASADSYATAKNIGLTITAAGVLNNDTDANSDALTASVVTPPAHGALTLNANGSFTFTPAANYTGADSFTYRASDGVAFSANTTVTLTINNSNGAPVAVADSYSLAKSSTLNIAAAGVLANDSDADGNPLTAVLVSAPANGSLTLNANGSFTFTPTAGFTGNSSFTYRANDGTANSANATVTLSITNTPPVASAESYATLKNIGLTIAASGVLANDTDANGDALTASVVSGPANGSLALNANGSFTFTPTANYTGADSFTYRASDGVAFSANTTVTLTINNSNAAPVAVANSYSLAKNLPLTVAAAAGVLANDSDVDGNPLTAVLVSAPANGSLTLNANGSFTFTPTTGFTGNSSFTYRANDGSLNSANTTVTLSITNTPPIASADSYATAKNIGLTITAAGVLNNDTDANSDALTASVVTPPAHGALTLNANGGFTFTPTANYTGADSFTYRASDGSAFSANTTVTLTINNSNGAPVAVADSYSLAKSSTLNIAAAGVLANDSDADGNPLTAVLVSAPANGSLTLNANGSFTFTPTTGFTGNSSFTYRANDGALNSANTTVTLSITNIAPVAQGDSYETLKNIGLTIAPVAGLLNNDSDANGDALTASVVAAPAHGALTLNANGSFTFTPAANYVGADSFTYRASDGAAFSATTLVLLTIANSNAVPATVGESYSLAKNLPLTVAAAGVLANDSDADGQPLTASLVTSPANGAITLNANGSFTFTPTPGYAGSDSFIYRASDGTTNSANTTVNLTITNTPPVAIADSYATLKNIGLNIAAGAGLLADDTDANGDALTASVLTAPAHGSVTVNANGSFTFTPTANYVGGDSFTYRANDGSAFSTAATVTLTINNSNAAPVAVTDSYSLAKNSPLTIAAAGVLANDSDVDGQPLTASLVAGPANGSLSLNANGSFTFTPTAGFAGSDSFTYRASDGATNSATATVNLSITNTPPVASTDSYVTLKNIGLTVATSGVLNNDTDANGDALTASVVTSPAHGALALNANGSFTFTPAANFTGTDSFTYRANDGTAFSTATTVTLTINNSNAAPVAVANSYSLAKNLPLTVAAAAGVLANDSDVDGNPLTAQLVSGPANGSLTLNANGSFTFTPAAGFAGGDSFIYRANDGSLNSANTTVTLSVTNIVPVANSDSFVTLKNIGLNVAAPGLLADDTDANGDTLTASVVTAPANGQLNLSANGGFTYTPTANYVGADSFTYRVSDGSAFSAVTTVTLSINNSNGAPVAVADSYSMMKSAPLTVPAAGVLANDSDPDGNPLVAVLVSGPANGALTLNANGSFTFTPVANYVGSDSFTYRASDGSSNSASTTVTLSMTNTAPVAQPESYATAKNLALTVAASGLLANDSDADGHALTAALVSGPANGSLTLNANGSFTFTPTAGYTGGDSFVYRANDGAANSANITVAISITNTAPVAQPNGYATSKNIGLNISAALGVLADDTDANGDALTASVVTAPAHGALTLNANGSFTFTPTANYTGADSFTYRASDGVAFSANTTVTLTINNSNGAPVVVADSFALAKNTPLTIAATGVLANDSDPDDDALAAVLVTAPTRGTLNLNANGGFTFTPNANYVGADSFTYRATDGSANSANTTVTLSITNTAPVANPENYSTAKNLPLVVPAAGVLANDADAEDNTLTAALVGTATGGAVSLNANGGFTFTPAVGFAGTASFTYRANDGTANSANATVSIAVTNIAPVAQPDSYTTSKNIGLSILGTGVLANDSDANSDALTASVVTTPAHGTLALNANGRFTFTPAANYTGLDSFTYRASDGAAFSAPVTVTITINNSNGAPVVVAENFSLAKNTPLTVAAAGVLANDSDPDGDTMTAALVSGPAHGVLNLSESGGFTFTPEAGYAGGDSFVYRATDGSANSANVTVTLSITNTVPVALPDSYATVKNIGLTVSAASGVLNNDSDANGDALTASVVAAPTRGSLTLNTNGSFTFTPTANYVGADSFTYRVNDGTAFSAATTVSLMINSSNGAPVAVADNFTLAKNSTLIIPAFGVLANDSDPDGEILAATLVSAPARGTLTFNANGSFSYAPTTGYVGSDSFTYRVSDGALNSANATVTLSITNTAPVANADSFTTAKNIGFTIAAPGLLVDDTDANGDALTASLETAPPHGTLELNDDGSFTFTPTANYTGSGTFTYRVNDGAAFSPAATVTIVVNNSNTAPVAVADSYSTPRNTKLTVGEVAGLLVNDTDVDEDALTAVLVSPPARGTLALSADGSLTYTPTNNFHGQDSFAYRAHDGLTNSAITTVTLTVLPPPNVAPVARNENYVVLRNTTLTVAPAGVLANDTDADGNSLTAVLVAEASHGIVTLNMNGGFSYTPVANYTGQDTFTYRADDGLTNSGVATVFLSVQPPVNTPPVARGENYSTVRGVALSVAASVGVLANDTDADGTALTASLAVPTANGTLVLAPGGSFLYTPRAGFTGIDGFSYRVSDGVATATAVATIRVNEPPAANVAPVAAVDHYEGIKNETMVIEAHSGVLVNDTDENVDPLAATLVSNPAHGTLLFNEDGSFIYFPDVNFTGAISFSYFANDGTNVSATVQVTLAINEPPPVNTPPVAQPESFAAWKNTPLYVSWISGVLKNDSDADGDTLSASLVTSPAQGTVTLNWNGGFVFTPPQDFTGTVQFAYEAEDGLDSSETTLVTITVGEQVQTNAVPIATSDTYFTTKNTPLDVPATSGVLINDRDADDAVFFAGLYLPPTHGTVALNLDGSFTYTPTAEFTGTDSFAYEVSDGLDVSAPTLVTITINDDVPIPGGCQNCFAELDELMQQRSALFAAAIKARLAVPKNAACAQYGVLVFRTMTPQLGPLHDSAANKALANAGDCVAGALTDDLAPRFTRASSLAASKYTKSASNFLDSIVTSLASLSTVSNNSSRSKLLAAAANNFVRADKALTSGDLAFAGLEGRQLTCTFVKSGQTSRGTFVFGANAFIVEDSNGVPIKTGTYSYTRTTWNTGRLQHAFDQPTLGYQAGVPATWTFTYGRARHKISAVGLRGYFTSP